MNELSVCLDAVDVGFGVRKQYALAFKPCPVLLHYRTSLGVRLTSVITSSESTFVGFSDNRGFFVFLVVILFVFLIIVIIVWVLRWQLHDSDNPRFV
jgi:hypothetical protein